MNLKKQKKIICLVFIMTDFKYKYLKYKKKYIEYKNNKVGGGNKKKKKEKINIDDLITKKKK